METPNDDDGQPLRTPDPFAPQVPNKAVGSVPSRAGMAQKVQTITPPSLTAPKRAPGTGIKPLVKPSYRGTFVGQTQTTNGQMANKNVAWNDKTTGDKKYGKVASMQKDTVVWDGNDWVPQADFDYRAKQGQLKKK